MNLGTDAVTITCFSDELDFNPGVTIAAVVSEKMRRSVGSGNEQVPVAVVVDVTVGCASANHRFCQIRTDFVVYITEFAVCVVMKQVRQLGISDLSLNGVNVIFHVSIGGEDVKVSIEIEIEEEACEGKCQ